MTISNELKKLAKFLDYVLANRPDEFGLVLNQDGYIKIKDLLKGINEEDGYRFVKKSHIDEIRVTLSDAPIEILDDAIRACHREKLPAIVPAQNPPKLLYIAVRAKAHAHVLEYGITPFGSTDQVILSSDINMAQRIGKRRDGNPVMLTILVEKALQSQVTLHQYGQSLFLSGAIPVGCFTAPPLPKQKLDTKPKEKSETETEPKHPGSFYLQVEPEPKLPKDKTYKDRKKNKKDMAWKIDRKRSRKEKQKRWDDY